MATTAYCSRRFHMSRWGRAESARVVLHGRRVNVQFEDTERRRVWPRPSVAGVPRAIAAIRHSSGFYRNDHICGSAPVRRRGNEPRPHLRYGGCGGARRRRARVVPCQRARAASPSSRGGIPMRERSRDERAILDDPSHPARRSRRIVPNERAPLGIRVMQHGKDYMADKPGITTLASWPKCGGCRRRRSASTRSCTASGSRMAAAVKAGELVKAGAIGTVDPDRRARPASHQRRPPRPDWFWDPTRYGGIIMRHRLAPVRPVPLLHRLDERRDRRVAGAQRASSRASGRSRTSAT